MGAGGVRFGVVGDGVGPDGALRTSVLIFQGPWWQLIPGSRCLGSPRGGKALVALWLMPSSPGSRGVGLKKTKAALGAE